MWPFLECGPFLPANIIKGHIITKNIEFVVVKCGPFGIVVCTFIMWPFIVIRGHISSIFVIGPQSTNYKQHNVTFFGKKRPQLRK